MNYEEKCPYCDGKGIIAVSPPDTTRVCTRCEGRGWVVSCRMEPIALDEKSTT